MENLKYTEILKLNKELALKTESKPYNIGILSNVTVNSLKEILEYSCRLNGINPVVEVGNYDNIVQDSATFTNKDLVVIFYDMFNISDSVSGFFEAIEESKYNDLKQKLFSEIDIIFGNLKSSPSVIFNLFSSTAFVQDYVRQTKIDQLTTELNAYLEEKKNTNVTLVNMDKLFSSIGVKHAIDYRFYHSSKAPYTVTFFKAYVSAIENILLKNTGKLKKAIIFDCDNTLWKGVIGEDGMEGIDLSAASHHGKFYNMVHHMAVFLSKRGVIVGICSKNNEADVMEVFANHKDMILKEEHVVIKKINWQDKATNLREIASELNIGIDSLVFVDDSSFEINLIREQLPEVVAIQVPANISEYPELLLKNIYKYFNLVLNADDAKKTEMYKQQFQRENSKNAFASIDDYLSSLEIELKILKDDTAYIPRISQLTQKTNQFNLTTLRYTEGQVEQFMASETQFVFAMFVKDKFGDSGLTGVCIVKQDETDPKKAVIDSLLMSCRILGRKIEYVYINTIIDYLREKGYEQLSAEFIPTKKNAQVESFYDTVGLTPVATANGSKSYSLSLKDFDNKNVSYIKVVSNLTNAIAD